MFGLIVSSNKKHLNTPWWVYANCILTLTLVMINLGMPMTPLFESLSFSFATLGLSIVQMIEFDSELTKHTCILSYVTTFQLLHVNQPHFAPSLKTALVEVSVVFIVVLIIAVEYLVAYYITVKNRMKKEIPATCQDVLDTKYFLLYGAKLANIVLLANALIPYSNVNVYLLPMHLKAVLIVVWIAFSATEAYKTHYMYSYDSTDAVSIPCKCAPILYLPYIYWYVVAVIIAVNLITMHYLNKKTKPHDAGKDSLSL